MLNMLTRFYSDRSPWYVRAHRVVRSNLADLPIQNSRFLRRSPDMPPSCFRSSVEEFVSHTLYHEERASLMTFSLHLRRLHHRRRQLVEVGSRQHHRCHRYRLRCPRVHPKHRAARKHEVGIQRIRRGLASSHEYQLTSTGTPTLRTGVQNRSDQSKQVAIWRPDSTINPLDRTQRTLSPSSCQSYI